ncbi:hypothetical protein O3M35_006370 [Rhynocoris fuscipes]|uniref:N-acetyltransferase domain-containing protein n=1 Tax=Rhynocoris fuscipes TaxID=488301 RepID=A0AAW1DIH7_9HEMI
MKACDKPNNRMYESFSVFCPDEHIESLDLLATEDILIDWSQPIYLNFTQTSIVNRIENFNLSIEVTEKIAGDIYVQSEPPEEELQLDELQGDECEVRELIAENAKAIHELYPAHDMEAVEVFEKLITRLPAYGVFSSGQLAAWMVQSYYGAMFSMQTRPEFRRKGYGIHLAQQLTRKVRSRGYVPFVVIRPENDASLSLYNKLGFKKSYETVRAIRHHIRRDVLLEGRTGFGHPSTFSDLQASMKREARLFFYNRLYSSSPLKIGECPKNGLQAKRSRGTTKSLAHLSSLKPEDLLPESPEIKRNLQHQSVR